MPYGLECDHYQVMGNIKDVEETVNKYTKETIYQLRLECNDMNLDVLLTKRICSVSRRSEEDLKVLYGFRDISISQLSVDS